MPTPMTFVDPTARIAADATVNPSAVIGPGVSLGRRVSVGPGAVIVGPCEIGDDCAIAAGCVIDPGTSEKATVVLEQGVRLHASVTIGGSVRIAQGATLQPGAVVTRNVPAHAIVNGNPGQITGYTVTSTAQAKAKPSSDGVGATASTVPGVSLYRFPKILDLRGNLSVGEFGKTAPFVPQRYFLVFGVPSAEVRGEHAHRVCKQFLICVHGSCAVVADDGHRRQEFVLDDPSVGLYLPPMVWGIQYQYSADAVLLVFASEHYDPRDYIRDYAEFIAALPGVATP